MILGMAELIQYFACSLLFAIKYETSGQILLYLHTPTVLHAIFHTHAVAIVEHSILIVNHAPKDVIYQIKRHRGVSQFVPSGEIVHFIKLTP